MAAPGEDIEAFKRAVAVDAAIGGNGKIHSSIVDASTGEVLMPEMAKGDEGHIRASRGRFREWLLQKVVEENVRWETKVMDVISDECGVCAVLEDGEMANGRMVVAAGGVHCAGKFIERRPSPRCKTAR